MRPAPFSRVRRFRLAVVVGVLAALYYFVCTPPVGSVRVATFNIRDFPEPSNQTQVAGAFKAIRELGALAVAVQEIVEPEVLAAEATKRLGSSWRFVYPFWGPVQRVGVLFDSGALELISVRTYNETRVYGDAKPAFEARFRPLGGGATVRMIVVHLKAGETGIDLRQRQLRALRPVLIQALASGDRIALLGDFNATSDEDRSEIAEFASATGMVWASKHLPCTSYWGRTDGCKGTPLDQVLTSKNPSGIKARGPCESVGCEPGRQCPVFFDEVSDHCPVTVDLGR